MVKHQLPHTQCNSTVYLEIFAVCIFHDFVLSQDFQVLSLQVPLIPEFSHFKFDGLLLFDSKLLFSTTQPNDIFTSINVQIAKARLN